MPSRLVCVALLLYWSVSAVGLITRDLLPELSLRSPPDLRTISRAERVAPSSRWVVQVVDDPSDPEGRRTVGQAMADATRRPDGGVQLESRVWFDSGGLLKGTPFANKTGVQIEVLSTYQVDASGNLRSFRAVVKSRDDPDELLVVEGHLKNHAIEITSRGPLPIMSQTRTIPYEPRGVVQNAVGPIDRLPGLQVGQRWDTRIISPMTGKADLVRVEVTRRTVIQWDNNPVTVLELVQHMTPLSARTWVRPDGLVLRQEIPFPFVKLVLERLPDDAPSFEVPAR
jgi:hypothetical protein